MQDEGEGDVPPAALAWEPPEMDVLPFDLTERGGGIDPDGCGVS